MLVPEAVPTASHPRRPGGTGDMHDANAQKVSWFELFYDLIVVAAVSQAGKVLVKSPDWETTALIAAGILVLFTMWLLTTLSHGLFPGDDPVRRVRATCLPPPQPLRPPWGAS